MSKPNLLQKLAITGMVGVIGMMLNSSNARADSLTYVPPTIKENDEFFRSNGILTAIDIESNGFNETVNVDGTFWDFDISVEIPSWSPPGGGSLGGANGTELTLNGIHVLGPHDTDIPNNKLNELMAGPKFVPYGRSRHLYNWTRTDHPADHFDYHGIKWFPGALLSPGGFSQLTGPSTIYARHFGDIGDESFRDLLFLLGFSTPCLDLSNSSVSFISEGTGNGFLRFNIGEVAVLDERGGLSCGIDPKYQDDPILSAQWSVSDLEFLGTTSDGKFQFGGGTVTLTDPNGKFSFTGTFSEYIISDTSDVNPLSSFGLFDNITITDVGDETDVPSMFLEDFGDKNLLGIDVPESILSRVQGIDFSFLTSTNFATKTNGFSQTVLDEPITATVSANGTSIPEPSPILGLLFFGGLGTAITLKRKLK